MLFTALGTLSNLEQVRVLYARVELYGTSPFAVPQPLSYGFVILVQAMLLIVLWIRLSLLKQELYWQQQRELRKNDGDRKESTIHDETR